MVKKGDFKAASVLSQLLTPMQKQRINDGDSVLVKTEYIVDSWKEYWLGKEQDEEQDY